MSSHQPLSGLRVIDLADERGELCGRLLADLGADVLRIEPPSGARSRAIGPFAPDGTSLYFAYRNTNKRGAVLDLDDDGDRGRLRELVAEADVVIESDKPGALGAIGLGASDLLAINPELIVASLTDFGQTGPYRDFQATDDVVFAMSGWLSMSGIPEKPPLLCPGALAYDTLGIIGAYAVMCALYQRNRGGGGQHLDCSALEALVQMNTWGIPNSSASLNQDHEPSVVRAGTSPMYPMFATEDGYVRQVLLAPRQWIAVWEWMGSPEAFADEYWHNTFNRMMNIDVINPLFEEHWGTLSMVEGAAEAQRRGVVATPMLKPSDVLVNDHFVSRNSFVDEDVSATVSGPVMAGFFEMSGQRVGYRFRSPELGEHNASFDGPRYEAQVDADEALDLPLRGVRVLDFGHGGVGVEGGRMLAEYGADVIKMESQTYPDFIRIILGSNMTPSFSSSSRSKRGFGVNLKSSEGREIVKRLAATADVVIENNSTGTMDALGIGYDDLREANPDIVFVSSQLMGAHGTFASWSGYGPTIQTVGGLNWLWNFADGDPPPGSNAIHPDHLAGRLCAIAGLAGVLGRDVAPGGQHVEVAQVEALMATLGDLFLLEGIDPGAAQPEGNDDVRGAPWGVFPNSGDEDWCVICVRDDADWQGLKRAMGDPAWADDPAFDAVAGRIEARDQLNEAVSAWTSGRSSQQVQDACQDQSVPAGAMATTVSQLSDPHLAERGFLVEIEQQGIGPITLEGPCFYGSSMGTPIIFEAPMMGQHTLDICRDDLAMSDAEIDALVEASVLEVYDG